MKKPEARRVWVTVAAVLFSVLLWVFAWFAATGALMIR